MCALGKGNEISCEFSFYPLGDEDFVSIINRVLEIIESYNLSYEIGPMSTFVKGKDQEVLSLLAQINQEMTEAEIKYSMNITMSNTCGI